ncbi:glycosyltransferase [Candidatus Micrarchaeota archaeon]|nr:glycosyltransferase [Candidatus Micrarchaeota archaeon]
MSGRDFSELTIILPTLNEEKNVGKLVSEIKRRYSGCRILLVDDGSTDRTLEIAEEKGARTINRATRQTKGITASVIEGIRKTNTEYFIVMDSDLQHPVGKVGELFEKMVEGNGLVVGYRTSVPGWAFNRKILSKGAEMLGKARLVIGGHPMPRDILSGFFGGKTKTMKEWIAKNPGRFVGEGYKVLFDIIKGLDRKNVQIAEVGYVFGKRKGGSSKIGIKHIFYFLNSVFT